MIALLLALACSDYKLQSSPDVVGDTGVAPTRPDDAPPDDVVACETWSPGPDYAVVINEDCLRPPEVGIFDPVVEWWWDLNDTHGGYEQNMSTPVVGDVSGDGVPDIVFTSYPGSSYSSPGTLTAISGDGSGMHWSISEAGGYRFYGAGGVALGDLEGDGLVEICVAGVDAAITCVAGEDGSLVWAAGSELSAYGFPAIADMDGDGLSEVIFGRQIISFDGATVITGDGGTGGGAFMSFAVDWDDDGRLEVIAGRTIYEQDGGITWEDVSAAPYDGYPAVGDFDGDGLPDLVRSGGSRVTVTANDGTQLWETELPGGGGGAPTVADFDGDGVPEVGVAGFAYYTMFDTDGAIIWSNPTEDDSSSVTGSAVFDFEGDGRAEVVYADEHNLYVYDGATGAVVLQDGDHASGTLYEYPVIADVDGDGATEIIIGSNDMWWEGWNGVTIVGSESGSWAPARPVWNQFAYHITNIDDDGGVPLTPTENWLTWNNFRAGGTALGPANWLPDLRDGEIATCLDECAGDVVELAVSVENAGLLPAENVSVSLRAGSADGPEVESELIPRLDAGGGTWTSIFSVRRSSWSGPLTLVIDAGGGVEECDELNNVVSLGPWPCP